MLTASTVTYLSYQYL